MSTFANTVALKKFFFSLSLMALLALQCYKAREPISLWFSIKAFKPSWAENQIASDFEDFQTISQNALDETFAKIQAKGVYAYRFRILDGKIYCVGEQDSFKRAQQFQKILKRLNRAKKIPNVDFIICLSDGVPERYHPKDFWITEAQAPLLSWAKRKDLAPYVVLIPDFLTTKEASWHKEIANVNEMYNRLSWEKREEKAFWRGASNDKEYTLENFKNKPRFLISALSREAPDLIDAGFCRVYPEEVESVIGDLGLIVGNTPVIGHLQYKYLPVLDGFMCTFPGFQWRLLSGSLTFKQESEEVQYFYSALKPYEHYIPIKSDMSNLIDQLNWAKNHDEKCRQIAENARDFALKNLMPNQIYAYLYWALEKYASLQDFDLKSVHFGPEWQEQGH